MPFGIKDAVVLELSEFVLTLRKMTKIMKVLILLISMFFAFAPSASATTLQDDENTTAAVQEGYSLILLDAGESKLMTVKAIKETLEIGLKEAKEIVDAAPNSTIIAGLEKENAEKYLEALKEAGLQVEMKAPGNAQPGE